MSLPFRQEDGSSELPSEPPGLNTWQTVHVRNTFIEVDESAEPRADPAVPSSSSGSALGRTWRRGHLRCASEPMSSFFARPPWEPMSLATSPLDALQGAALQTDALGAMLDMDPSRHEPSNPIRGRVSTSLGATLMRSPRAHSYVSTMRESAEYEALRRIHFPKYIDINTDFVGQGLWRAEPMTVDVHPNPELPDSQERVKDAYRAHTLACPVRSFRHARQRSRTIQEDKELVDAQTLDELAEDVQPHLTSQSSWDNFGNVNFRVRNTFIEVDETGSESCADLLSPPRWRPSHLRCASEPIHSFENGFNGRHSGFHSRTSSYQAADDAMEHIAEVLQAQAAQALQPDDKELGKPPGLPEASQSSQLGQRLQETRHAAMQSMQSPQPPLPPAPKDFFTEAPAQPVARGEGSNAASIPGKTLQCKWHVRGTCKYGAACRFSHDLPRNVQKKPGSSASNEVVPKCMSNSGPLPAGRLVLLQRVFAHGSMLQVLFQVRYQLALTDRRQSFTLHHCHMLLALPEIHAEVKPQMPGPVSRHKACAECSRARGCPDRIRQSQNNATSRCRSVRNLGVVKEALLKNSDVSSKRRPLIVNP